MAAVDILSARERQVFTLIGAGRAPHEIGDTLGLSVKTVSTYRARVLEKLRVESNAELAVIAWRTSEQPTETYMESPTDVDTPS